MLPKLLKIAEKRHRSLILVILIVFNLPRIILNCTEYASGGFDSQAVFTWNYTASINQYPYKELFYPYGLLAYYREPNQIFHLIFQSIMPLTYFLYYLLFFRFWKNVKYSIYSFLLFFLFTHFVSAEIVSTYGFVLILSSWMGILFNLKKINHFVYILIGVGIGLIFSLLHPQGFYLILIFLAGLFIKNFLLERFYLHKLKLYLKETILFVIGLTIGLLPLVLYFINKNQLDMFIHYFGDIPNLSLYAKSAFIPHSVTPENIITFISLIIVCFYLSYVKYFKRKFEMHDYVIIQIFITTILFESVSIIRSIDQLITFIPMFIAILFLSIYLRKKYIRYRKRVLILFTLSYFVITNFFLSRPHPQQSNLIYTDSYGKCVDFNLNKILKKEIRLKKVVNQIHKQKIKHLFSFPADPIFYIVTKQKTPFYLNNYDSATIKAQERQMKFLVDNNITTIIYNTNLKALQDNIPNFIRTKYLAKYILNNYEPYLEIDGFIFMKKTNNHEFPTRDDLFKDFYNELLNVDLQSIPLIEGMYKFDTALLNNELVRSSNQIITSQYFKLNNVYSDNILILVKSSNSKIKTSRISIGSEDGLETHIEFKSCHTTYCLLNLESLPLFYNKRKIVSITHSDSDIRIIKTNNLNKFW